MALTSGDASASSTGDAERIRQGSATASRLALPDRKASQMTTTATRTPLGEPVLDAALDQIESAKEGIARARRQLEFARADLSDALRDWGKSWRHEDVEPPTGIVRRLYWEVPEARVSDVARAVGVPSKDIKTVAGPREVATVCNECKTAMTVQQTTRGESLRWARCGDCVERQRRLQALDDAYNGPPAYNGHRDWH